MRIALFHIGSPKTGSTALQSFLSANSALVNRHSGQKFMYCCMGTSGRLVHGASLALSLQTNGMGYVASSPELPASNALASLRSALDGIYASGYLPLFSQEAWFDRAAEFSACEFFAALDVQPHIVLYLRPQVDWLNSAWWQFLAWDPQLRSIDDVMAVKGLALMDWLSRIEQWQSLVGPANVTVRLHCEDIIADFLGLLGLQAPEHLRKPSAVNRSLPPVILKLMLRFPELGLSQDLLQQQALLRLIKPDHSEKPPWVVDQQVAEAITQGLKQSNLSIMSMLDSTSARAMSADDRWWSASAYADKHVTRAADWKLSQAETEAILKQVLVQLLQRS